MKRTKAYDIPLPHDLDAEKAVLGSMLQSPDAIAIAVARLEGVGSAAFFHEPHRVLWDVVVGMYGNGHPPDAIQIKDELFRIGKFESVGGWDFLAALVNAVPSAVRVGAYADIVRREAVRREAVNRAHLLQEMALDNSHPFEECVQYAQSMADDLSNLAVMDSAESITDEMQRVFAGLETMSGQSASVPCGIMELDEMMGGGFRAGQLIIVGGRPGMGKTALAMQFALHAAREGYPTGVFSLEMSRHELAVRLLCSASGVDSRALERGRINNQQLERLKAAERDMRSIPLFIDETAAITPSELSARAAIMKRTKGVRLVVVDYLGLMKLGRKTESLRVEVTILSAALKAIAKTVGVAMLVVAQLNRESAKSGGRKPTMTDLRESGSIEQDADAILFVHRDSYYADKGTAEAKDPAAKIIVAKQRAGDTGEVDVFFDRARTRFVAMRDQVTGWAH